MHITSRSIRPASTALAAVLLVAAMPIVAAQVRHDSSPAQEITDRGGRELPAQIAGVIRVDGCVPSPAYIDLSASPLRFGVDDGRMQSPDPRASTPTARLSRTSDPHVLAFVIRGTNPNTAYRLAVEMSPGSACGKVFWRGPALGFVQSGQTGVLVEGVSAQTVLEVASDTTGDWVGADDLRFAEVGRGRRTLRWRSSLAGITAGELQVSTNAFPTDADFTACEEPETGIVYRQIVPAGAGDWADIPTLDFSAILNPGRVGSFDSSLPDPSDASPVSPSTYRMLLAGAPLYVRVVPHRGTEPVCDRRADGVPGWVILAQLPGGFGDPPSAPPTPPRVAAGNGHVYTPPYLGGSAQGHPMYHEFAYKIIKPHVLPKFKCVGFALESLAQEDPLGCVIVNAGWAAPGSTIQPGPWFFFTPPPPKSSGGGLVSFLTGSFTFIVTGAIDAIGLTVDFAAKLWDDVKAAIVKLALQTLLAIPPGDAICGAIGSSGVTSCKGMIEAGLTIALASAGMPPSLPNWEQLKDQGLDYVAAQVASEIAESVSPVPPAVTEAVVKELAQQVIDKMSATRGGSDPKTNWVIPYLGYEPATWTVVVNKSGGAPMPRLWLNIPESPLFVGGKVSLPIVWPSSGQLTVPIVLKPNLAGINPPYCWAGWMGSGCIPQPSPYAQQKCEWVSGGTWQYFEVDCETMQMPGIYYRDAWVNGKLLTTPCADVQAWTLQDVGGQFFPAPDAYKMAVMGRLRPRQALAWNGPFIATCTK